MEVELIACPGDDMLVTFIVTGPADLVWPDWAEGERADGLWQTTCFELFLKPPEGTDYLEFNFSPSTHWAAYRFSAYRTGREDFHQPVDPLVFRADEPGWTIEIDFDLSGLRNVPYRMGVCAVIEEREGRKSYWALAHPPGDPDFHDPACFALELPAAPI